MANEPISQTCTVDGRRIKLVQDQVEKLRADVTGTKRFYTQDWLDQYLERFTVVADCSGCGEPLIAEERDSHGFKHVPARLRPMLRMYMDLDADDRQAVRDFVAAAR